MTTIEKTNNLLASHTYFLCDVEFDRYYTVIDVSNDYRNIAQQLFTQNGCKRDLVVLVNFDGILYPFHQGDRIDLTNPAIWVKRDDIQFRLVNYEYKPELATN